MACRTEPKYSPLPDDANTEVCDKCGKWLNLGKNEDIWLSKICVVLCAECHDKHKGVEVYW